MNGIKVDALSWHPNNTESPILKEINFFLEPGYIYGILGTNGSGKTSLLKHLLGLLPPGKAVELNGVSLGKIKPNKLAKAFSYVPQNTAVSADFTVEELVMMGRAPHQKRFARPKKADQQAVSKAIRLAGLEQVRSKSALCLSGGEMQRVAVARAIAQQAEWMFLDEPVSSLDLGHQLELMEILKELSKKNQVTVVMVLHDINLAIHYCSKLLFMKSGRLYAAGETESTATAETLKEVYGLDFEELFTADGTKYMVPVKSSYVLL